MPATEPTSDPRLSEAAETPPRRRGRPKVTDAPWETLMGMTGATGRYSRRTIVNHFYRQQAFGVLHGAEGADFAWVIDRGEILAELGRLGDDDAILEAAAEICRRRMRTKEAVILIRRWRTGRSRPGDAKALAGEITRAIDAYLIRYPETTPDQVLAAVDRVRSALDLGFSEPEAGEDPNGSEIGG